MKGTTATGLKQMANVPTWGDAILTGALPINQKLLCGPVQLLKTVSSDHNAILIGPAHNYLVPSNVRLKTIASRNLRYSQLRAFGAFITSNDWLIMKQIPGAQEKINFIQSRLTFAVEKVSLIRMVKVSPNDKPWISPGLKLLLAKRQKVLALFGKSSEVYETIRNRIQKECSAYKKRFYVNEVSNPHESNSSRWWKDIK